MDFNLKQWREESEEEDGEASSAKLPRLLLSSTPHQHHHHSSPALPLFVPDPTSATLSSSDNNSTTSATKFPRMGSDFSLAQWQELELQALIFRQIMAGAAVPPELLHLVKKSLITSSSSSYSSSPYYLSNPPHHYCYPHYQPPSLQSGYWSKAAMDPEPGRCRRTDGKKWRCSRDVVAGQKYCERHMHRGRNRSRKPVEIHTSSTTADGDNGGGGEALKANYSTSQGISTSGGGCTPQFSLSESLTSMDFLHPNRSMPVETNTFEAQTDGPTGGDRTLRCFFDDWPRSHPKTDNAATSATNLSISTSGSNPSSDFSLKLGTGNGDDCRASGERDRPQLNWGMAWEANRVGPMGGPLAEALRSSVSTSSPISVLQRVARSSASGTSYVSS